MGSFSIFHWIILAVIVLVIVAAVRGGHGSGSVKSICKRCGFTGFGKTITRGSIAIEIILWLCFLVPGLIYSIWRLTTRHAGCPHCGSSELIPLDSPIGRKLAAEINVTPAAPRIE